MMTVFGSQSKKMDSTHQKFNRYHAALMYVVGNIRRGILLLQRLTKKRSVNKDDQLIKLAVLHYIINNLDALFDENISRFSLVTISIHFKKDFPEGFFDEFSNRVTEFVSKHKAELERIRINRNLSSAHFGADQKVCLGYSPDTAARFDEILGTSSPVAPKIKFRFVMVNDLLQMSLVKEIYKLENILGQLLVP